MTHRYDSDSSNDPTARRRDDGETVLGLQMRGYRLATAEILYRLPDHPSLLQSFVWQQYDLAPFFPKLKAFLAFWEQNIEGALHSVRMGHKELISPAETRSVDSVFRLH